MNQVYYRKLRNYKYQLKNDYEFNVAIEGFEIKTPYLELDAQGKLLIKNSYAWDGPSGPTFDTFNFMRGSLIHDALYQLIRLQEIPYSYRDHADRLLRDICRQDGMSKLRSWIVYQGVKTFGRFSAKPGTDKQEVIIRVPI